MIAADALLTASSGWVGKTNGMQELEVPAPRIAALPRHRDRWRIRPCHTTPMPRLSFGWVAGLLKVKPLDPARPDYSKKFSPDVPCNSPATKWSVRLTETRPTCDVKAGAGSQQRCAGRKPGQHFLSTVWRLIPVPRFPPNKSPCYFSGPRVEIPQRMD